MKKVLPLILALAIALSLGACGGGGAASTPEGSGSGSQSAAGDYEWPNMVKLSITGSGTTAYAGTLAWSNILEGTGYTKVRLLPEDSNATKFQRVKNGETLMTYDSMGDAATLVNARFGYATEDGGPYQVRWVWPDFESIFVMFVRGDSKIEKPTDITKDTAVACTIDSAMENVKAALAAATGVSGDEMNWIHCSSYGEMPKLVTTGAAELCGYVTPVSSSIVEASSAPQGIRVLDFNPELYPDWCKAFQSKMPVYNFSKIPLGIDDAIGKYGVGSDGGWLTSEDADQELIYNMVKFFAEHQEDIQGAFDTYAYYWSVDYAREVMSRAFIPIAEGTIQYFKELGKWTEADDARQEYNIKVIDKYAAAYSECLDAARADGIKIDTQNQEWLDYWEEFKANKDLPPVVIMSDAEIAEALAAGF
ncbi:hypothetical protein KQI82_14460 [Oscillibacter sp. MSJ-2]|uniref:Uncharacterized protein n=1 Tax=Dysosmobacter acutus TaxID=2841504 RepID=A0ABS6FCW3_9FIRM|nr:TAXI family TRAP transporter solute-binding subunit [Dysosmobacter acutus]MBU5628112.1 hypothetical protein [Dysosmobacter acutus]